MKGISRCFLFLLPLTLLAGCPSSSAPDVQGTWAVTLEPVGRDEVSGIAAVVKDGPAFIYAGDGQLYVFFTPLTDQRSLEGGVQHYELDTCDILPCIAEVTDYAGTAYADHIGLTFSVRGLGNSGDLPDGIAELDRSDSAVDGVRFQDVDKQWQGYSLPSNAAVTLTNDGDGNVTGAADHGCTFSGTIEPAGAGLYSVTLSGLYDQVFRRCDAGAVATATGAGYFSATGIGPFKGVPGLYFLTGVSSEFSGHMLEFKVK